MSRRWYALDAFRGLAVLWMIQGHVFTALLHKAAYNATWERPYAILHGLTAPMFLLGAGLAYGLAGQSRSPSHGVPPGASRQAPRAAFQPVVLRRAAWLLLIGYGLQFPGMSLRSALASPDMLARAFQVGPLQLVAACLLFAECLRVWTATPRRFTAATSLLLFILLSVSPLVWNARLSTRWHVVLGTWLDGHSGSYFPFFPWACFFFIGLLASALARVRWRAAVLVGCGSSVSLVCYLLFLSGVNPFGRHEFWHTSPLYVGFRTGLVLCWLGVLCALEAALREAAERGAFWFVALDVFAKQALVAYVVHMFVLYGTPFSPGFAKLGTRLTFGETSLAFFAVLTTTWLMAFAWSHLKPSFVAALRASARAALRS